MVLISCGGVWVIQASNVTFALKTRGPRMEDAPTDGGSVKNRTPLEAEKNRGGQAPMPSRQRAYSERMTQVRAVLTRLDETEAWDTIQAKELPPELIEHVEGRFQSRLDAGQQRSP